MNYAYFTCDFLIRLQYEIHISHYNIANTFSSLIMRHSLPVRFVRVSMKYSLRRRLISILCILTYYIHDGALMKSNITIYNIMLTYKQYILSV